MAIIAETTPQGSFWAANKNLHERAMALQAKLSQSKPHDLDLDQDPDQEIFRSRSIQIDQAPIQNPDGLDAQIKGQYAELLKADVDYLQARAWGVHPSQLTNATKRMGSEWVKKEVRFVAGKAGVRSKGRYLAKLLAGNPF